MAFTAIPVLDLSRARAAASKPGFLQDLRRALLEVGFLYISHTGIDEALVAAVVANAHAFFDLPREEKMEVQMVRERSFLGYNLLGGETTAQRTDWREQLDLSTPHPIPGPDAPLYHNLLAPNQWPSAAALPTFRPTYEAYIAAMAQLATDFTSLIAEALDLPATAFDRYFDRDQQHKLKIVRYPDVAELGPAGGAGSRQGVGPHKDSMLTSYLLQATPHAGLQAQNVHGVWIDCPPKPGTLVVALGQGLEALTQGVCASTTHRVLSPPAGGGARLSVPFFQGVSYDATFESMHMPEGVRAEKRRMVEAEGGERRDDVEFTFVKGRWGHLGEATLYNRAKSHPDVAQRWYPELWERICKDREEERRKKEGVERGEGEGEGVKKESDGLREEGNANGGAAIEAH